MQHDEHHVAVLLDLGPLVALARILHGQLVQAEFLLHLRQFFVRRVAQRHPDKGVGLVQPVADVVHADVGKLAPVFVGNTIDEHVRWGVEVQAASAASMSPASLDGASCGA